jgi:bacillithiol biosynthesis cysteine-adding enzyme BshC
MNIPHSIQTLNPLVHQYLIGGGLPESIYPGPSDNADLLKRIKELDFPAEKRKTLVQVIQKQYNDCKLDIPESLASLEKRNTTTITTGHQLGYLGGPAYFIYKIVSIIKLAQNMTIQSGTTVIPVFWMATEDHDVDEIKRVVLRGVPYEFNPGNPAPAGRIAVPQQSMADLLNEWNNILGLSSTSNEIKSLFSKALKNKTLADFTRHWVHGLFGKYGLIILDADDKDLKQEAEYILNEELLQGTTKKIVTETNETLSKLGFKNQAGVREINLFEIKDQTRKRIISVHQAQGSLNFDDGTEGSLPVPVHHLSPNVLLRPVYQQAILPNIAYVGGPGELAYWLQLKDLMCHFNVYVPALILRDSFVFVSESFEKTLASLKISARLVLSDADSILNDKLLHEGHTGKEFITAKHEMEAALSSLKTALEKSGINLEPGIQSLKRDIEKRLDQMNKRKLSMLRRKEQEWHYRFKNIQSEILHQGKLKERYESAFTWCIYFPSADAWITALIRNSDPFNATIKLISMP